MGQRKSVQNSKPIITLLFCISCPKTYSSFEVWLWSDLSVFCRLLYVQKNAIVFSFANVSYFIEKSIYIKNLNILNSSYALYHYPLYLSDKYRIGRISYSLDRDSGAKLRGYRYCYGKT